MIKTYCIKVKFEGNYNEYSYRSFEKCSVGDYVVVQARDGMAIAQVSATGCNGSMVSKFVLCRIDIEEMKRLIERYNAQKVLEDRLEEIFKETSKANLYRQLAESNEEAKELIAQLERIN